jgi:hypothetical protein
MFTSRMLTLLRGLGTAFVLVVQATAQTTQASTPGGYTIAGTIVSKTDGHPLAQARVTVQDVKDSKKFQSLVTAEDGKFKFSGLPAAKYSLNGAKRGFISAAYDQHDFFWTAIVTGSAFDTESLVLRLAPAAVITGKILDETGDPIRRAMVAIYIDDHTTGVDQIHRFRVAQTDDQGAYEITPLMPGTYFLSASAQPWYAVHPSSEGDAVLGVAKPETSTSTPSTVDRSLDVAYPTTYYPDVTDADSATPIPIRGGERIDVDIHLNPVPALRLIFRVPANGNNGYVFPQIQQPAFDGDTSVQPGSSRMISPGVLEMSGIPAGRYNLLFNGAGATTEMNGVDLNRDGEVIETSGSEAMSTVKVSAQVPAEATIPAHLAIGLRSGHRMLANWKNLDDKGEAQIDRIPPGKYEVLVWGPPKPYTITQMSAEGAAVSGHALTVTAGSSPSLSLTLVGGSYEIDGFAKRAGKPVAGVMVFLVPKNIETDRDFRRDQSDLDGSFTLRNIVPGSYTLLAIENGWDLDWSKPDVISAYLSRGHKIEVGSAGSHSVMVAEDVEVLSK